MLLSVRGRYGHRPKWTVDRDLNMAGNESRKGRHALNETHETALSGVFFAASAFLIWGLSPVYWKAMWAVGPLEIVMHRVVWSFAFLMVIILVARQWRELWDVLRSGWTLMVLAASALLVALNWLIYIWAVNNGFLLQASLGYYINPLVNVVLGMTFLRERLRPAQMTVVLLAAAGVIYLTVQYGQFPWISLVLAFSFGLYGLIRKVAPVSSLVGLTVETMLMSGPALAYLVFLGARHGGSIFRGDLRLDLLLMSTALMTAVPLLLFTAGARRIRLSTLGLMQYLAPSGMFLLAVLYYREPFTSAQLWTFVMIWTALAIYSADSLKIYRREHRPAGK